MKCSAFREIDDFRGLARILNGGTGGVVGLTCVYPIDLVKTRLQNQRVGPNGELQYRGIWDCAVRTWRSGGISLFAKIRALYTGSAVNITLITPEKAIKLVANDFMRYHLAVPGQDKLSLPRAMLSGAFAGSLQTIVTTPMELLKIQLQDQGRITGDKVKKGNEKKMTAIGVSMQLLRKHGIVGLYKGFEPTLCRDVIFSVAYFPLFAYLDGLGPRSKDGSGDAVFWTSFCAGMAAGAFASVAANPLDVIKTRIQTLRKGAHDLVYRNTADAFVSIVQTEGPQAFFKGAFCRCLTIAPLFAITQMVYYFGVAEIILGQKKAQHV
ncbi:glutamate carrier 1 [Ancylostoma caninum]|uniref:Glutamate carrier 1 n=1 Tax=Ancylostoma caninum TaxID=29170 RepID=A0A368GWS2_ANCCA|nr:glutamate carrier 1 [Ancylostoma caninum]